MPASSAVSPTPKTMLPGQSTLPPTSLVPDFVQRDVGPDRADDAERHAHDEDEVPVDGGEDATDDQAEERSGDRGDLVEPEREPAAVRREGIREDGGRVGEQHRAADRLHDSPEDQPERAAPAGERIERQRDGGDGEDHEAEVVDPDPAEDVAEAPEARRPEPR